jgi:hypothetical protein
MNVAIMLCIYIPTAVLKAQAYNTGQCAKDRFNVLALTARVKAVSLSSKHVDMGSRWLPGLV